jgi:hypothetical protein
MLPSTQAVHPDRRARLVGVAANSENGDVATFRRAADTAEADEIGMLRSPRAQLLRELGVVEIFVAEH